MIRLQRALLLGCGLAALCSGGAYAQSASGSQTDPETEATEVEEIVVTAERREQTLQNYAGVAQAITGEDLRAVGIDQIEDLQSAVPGLSIANQEGNVQI
jgi:iron complex outermembrane recepter protein